MKRWLSVLFVVLSFISVQGQSRIEGFILNSDSSAVINAKIELLRSTDSEVLSSTQSDQVGRYSITNLASGTYTVRASYFQSEPIQKKVMVWENSSLTVNFIINDFILLDEVKILSNGIEVRGDTTTYVVGRFTSGSENTLKELLERLPNIRVDESAKSITANGKQVSRILVENQDLFQANTSIPLENLSAKGIDKVDIIENYSEYNIYEGFKTTHETVLNIGVNDNMKSKSKGDAEIYGGVLNKYNARNSSLYIGSKSMFSGILSSNNIGFKLLNFQDVLSLSGGVKNLLISGANPMESMTDLLQTYSPFINSRKDIKQRENSLLSLNYIGIPSSKLKITLNGIYNYDRSLVEREDSYRYLSGLQYRDSSIIKDRMHNSLINMKLAYTPSQVFNIIYSGNAIFNIKKDRVFNKLADNRLNTKNKPELLNTTNDLLFIRKFDRNTLNLLLSYNRKSLDQKSFFQAEQLYYPSILNLPDAYRYNYTSKLSQLAAQLFYIHRISPKYYLRLSATGKHDRQAFTSSFDEEVVSTAYHNDETLNYTRISTDALLGKDSGKFNFDIRISYALLQANTNLKKRIPNRKRHFIYPKLSAKYVFTPTHHIAVTYDYDVRENTLLSLLDEKYLKSYNQVVGSSLNRLYYKSHKASLMHFLMFPYLGVNMMNLISYENSKDSPIDSSYQYEYISLSEKRNGRTRNQFSYLSTIEYRFIPIPLNIQANLNYTYTYLPIYNFDVLYKSKLNGLNVLLKATTYYKKGFNGTIQWAIDKQTYRGLPMKNKRVSHKLFGELTWHNDKLYTNINARFDRSKFNTTRVKNIFYGFELKYRLSENYNLKLSGMDIMHLSERKQTTGIISPISSIDSKVWYMPGHMLLGVLIRY